MTALKNVRAKGWVQVHHHKIIKLNLKIIEWIILFFLLEQIFCVIFLSILYFSPKNVKIDSANFKFELDLNFNLSILSFYNFFSLLLVSPNLDLAVRLNHSRPNNQRRQIHQFLFGFFHE